MEENKLKLNSDKTEAIRFSASSSVNLTLQLPHTISLSNTDIEFSGIVRNPGFIFDSDISMKQHIIKTCKAAYIEIRRMSSIRLYLTEDVTKALVSSCILSRLDYCNFLLTGCLQTFIKPLQQVQNSATKLILKSRRAEHAKSLLKISLAPHETENQKQNILSLFSDHHWHCPSVLGWPCPNVCSFEVSASPPSNENSIVVGLLFLCCSPDVILFG